MCTQGIMKDFCVPFFCSVCVNFCVDLFFCRHIVWGPHEYGASHTHPQNHILPYNQLNHLEAYLADAAVTWSHLWQWGDEVVWHCAAPACCLWSQGLGEGGVSPVYRHVRGIIDLSFVAHKHFPWETTSLLLFCWVGDGTSVHAW